MTKICLCLTGKTLDADLTLIEKYRPYIDAAELRADCLLSSELQWVRNFPGRAGLPIIFTVRRKIDGGNFERGEASRIIIISKALSFAQTDHRKNFAYIDLEEDVDVPSLEEVSRVSGTRIIRSFHDFNGPGTNFIERVKSLFHYGDEIAKAAVMPWNIDDVRTVLAATKHFAGRDTILIAMGDTGQCARILAPKLGGYLVYASPRPEDNVEPAAPGQVDPITLCELYRFRTITSSTEVYGITGYPLTATSSPQIQNEAIARAHLNAVYLRFPSETIDGFMRLAGEIGIAGASVTVPHKQSVLAHLTEKTNNVKVIGACNTIIKTETGWLGGNTDAEGFSGSLLTAMNRKNFKRKKITIIGAGGAARAVAAEVARLGGSAIILNRNIHRAKVLAAQFGFEYAPLEEDSMRRVKKFRDVLVQTTSAGMEPDIEIDPLPFYSFTGRELVMDIIYKPPYTKFLSRAQEAGCMIINGYDMLLRQAKYQFEHFFNRSYPETPEAFEKK